MAAASNRFWWVPFGSVPEISAGDLHACITEGRAPCLLDVRTNREWVASRISGAVNLPITDFRSGLDALELDRGGAIVTICLTAHRSIPAVRALRAAGFRDVRQLQGGMRAWWKAGLPVVEGPES
jgi:rhodanese-related sulfurtransferase